MITKWTWRQDDKSNNTTQDDEKHSVTLRRRNHDKKNLDLCENDEEVILGQKLMQNHPNE